MDISQGRDKCIWDCTMHIVDHSIGLLRVSHTIHLPALFTIISVVKWVKKVLLNNLLYATATDGIF